MEESTQVHGRPYYKVTMPGWWYYTQDPPPKLSVILYWVAAALYLLWPLWLLVAIIGAATYFGG